jgi:hypothetical protein
MGGYIGSRMSTSHYSLRCFRVPPNTRRYTKMKYQVIILLLIIDCLALIGTADLVEAMTLVTLVVVNIWALNCTKSC